MIIHYIEFVYAGSFLSETIPVRISKREFKDPLPQGAYAYSFFDQEEVEIDGEVLKGPPKNRSVRYIKGDVYDLEQVKAEIPDSRILISNMENNGYDKVVKCSQGFIPLNKTDILIS